MNGLQLPLFLLYKNPAPSLDYSVKLSVARNEKVVEARVFGGVQTPTTFQAQSLHE